MTAWSGTLRGMPRVRSFLAAGSNRLGRRMIVQIILFSSAVTLCISVVQLAFEYRELRKALDQELDSVRIYVPNIAGSVWDFDEKQIRRALNALVLLPNVVQAGIASADTGAQWDAGASRPGGIVRRDYSLRHEMRGRDAEIGTLTVVASLEGLYRQILGSAASIVLSNALKTFLVALFLVYLIRRRVTLRLERLASRMHSLIPKDLPLPKGAGPQPMPAALDELDAMEWTLVRTAEALQSAVAALAGANKDLSGANERARDALRERDVLLKEIYHRVKNNLQVVSSLLNMQSRNAGPEGRMLLKESANRVKSMALVHEQLYRSGDLSRIGFGEYVARLGEHLSQAYRHASLRVTVRANVEHAIQLPIEVAIPLGLIVNELVSNAFKHAYPESAEGEIRIDVRRSEGPALVLCVADDGRGLPEGFDPRRTASLGMQLVVTLTGQIDGDLRWESAGGARFEVRFAPVRQVHAGCPA